MNKPTDELSCLIDDIDAAEIYESGIVDMDEIDTLFDAFFREVNP